MRKPSVAKGRIRGRPAGMAGAAAAAASAGGFTSRRSSTRASPSPTHLATTGRGRSESTKATANTQAKLDPVAVSATPANARPAAPATLLAVWYQAKDDATAFLPPTSAMRALIEGSRMAMDTPCRPRMAKRCQGLAAKTSSSDTTLRRTMAVTRMGLTPTRSATQPMAGFRAMATMRLNDARKPISARLRPSRNPRSGTAKLTIPKPSRDRNPSAMMARRGPFTRRRPASDLMQERRWAGGEERR